MRLPKNTLGFPCGGTSGREQTGLRTTLDIRLHSVPEVQRLPLEKKNSLEKNGKEKRFLYL